jgi:ABC-type transporter Mla MlaB component
MKQLIKSITGIIFALLRLNPRRGSPKSGGFAIVPESREVIAMSAGIDQTGIREVVVLEGDITLPQMEELRNRFIKALVNADEVSLSMENVREVDLSGLQLMCSAHRSAVRFKKRLAFSGRPPKALKDAVEAAGYARVTGCKLDKDKSCLWKAVTGDHHE